MKFALASADGFADLGKVIIALLAIIAVWPALGRQWRLDRAGFILTLKLIACYAVYCAAGGLLLVMFAPREPGGDEIKAIPMMALIFAWIVYGSIWLARLVPRYRQVPSWIDNRNGPIDRTLMAIIIGSVVWLLI